MGERRMHWAHPARWLQFRLRTLLILIALVGCSIVGYQQWKWHGNRRVVVWLDALLAQSDDQQPRSTASPWTFGNVGFAKSSLPTCPFEVTPTEEIEMLVYGAAEMTDKRHRLAAMRLIHEMYRDERVSAMKMVARRSRYDDTRALSLRIIGLERAFDELPFVKKFLNHRSSETRIAAIDSVGRLVDDVDLSKRSYEINLKGSHSVSEVGYPTTGSPKVLEASPSPLSAELRQFLGDRMVTAESAKERRAAALACKCFPPNNYKLRVAECELWYTPATIDDVHQLRPQFAEKVDGRSLAYNPKILMAARSTTYVDVSHTMALDVEYRPRLGDVTCTFPKRRQAGFPWLRAYSDYSGYNSIGYGANGRGSNHAGWHALIATRDPPDWFKSPARDEDSWWAKARCDTSYLGCADQSTQFLFHAAWTTARSPVDVRILDDDQLTTHKRNMLPGYRSHGDDVTMKAIPVVSHVMFIDTVRGPNAFAIVATPQRDHTFALSGLEFINVVEAKTRLTKLLVDQGLTRSEANVFVARESSQIFDVPGRRYLAIVNRDSSDPISSIDINPAPTTLVRIALILTKL